jgi:phosphatidylcholine synthase
MSSNEESVGTARRWAAWSVHLLSGLGVVLAFLALIAVVEQRWTEALVWLLIALAVDGIDGSLARAVDVNAVVPRIDGAALDLVVDYLTYVFVPAMFMVQASLLPAGAFGIALAALILLSSLYVFARRDMKTEDGYFRGFPALWNVVAIYLFATEVDRPVTAAIVAVLAAMSFAPVHFVHPFRVRHYGLWLPAIALLWAASTLSLLLNVPSGGGWILWTSAAAAAAIVALGLWRTMRGPRASAVAH